MVMMVLDLGGQFETEIEWIARLHFCGLVLAEKYCFTFVISNMDRQMYQTLNIVLCHVQIQHKQKMVMLVVDLGDQFDAEIDWITRFHVAFGPCWNE